MSFHILYNFESLGQWLVFGGQTRRPMHRLVHRQGSWRPELGHQRSWGFNISNNFMLELSNVRVTKYQCGFGCKKRQWNITQSQGNSSIFSNFNILLFTKNNLQIFELFCQFFHFLVIFGSSAFLLRKYVLSLYSNLEIDYLTSLEFVLNFDTEFNLLIHHSSDIPNSITSPSNNFRQELENNWGSCKRIIFLID